MIECVMRHTTMIIMKLFYLQASQNTYVSLYPSGKASLKGIWALKLDSVSIEKITLFWNFHPIQFWRGIQFRGVNEWDCCIEVKGWNKWRLWGYVGYITDDPWLEEVKSVVFREETSE